MTKTHGCDEMNKWEVKKMFIKSPRLVIREFEPDDWQAVYAYTSDMNVMKYIPEGVFSEKDAKKLCQ